MKSVKHNVAFNGLELKLDELRKELSSIHGGIFPHSILSTQQINTLSAQKPNSMEEASFTSTILFFPPLISSNFREACFCSGVVNDLVVFRLLHVNFSAFSVCEIIDC